MALLTCMGTAAAGLRDNGTPGRPNRPDWFLKVDGATAGLGWFYGRSFPDGLLGITLLKATAKWRRLRFGASVMEAWVDPGDGTLGPVPVPMGFPVHVGYDILDNRKRTWFFHSAVPNVHAEAGASYYPLGLLVVKGALGCDVDYYGAGVRLETGGYLLKDTGGTEKALYAGVQLRLLTFGFEL